MEDAVSTLNQKAEHLRTPAAIPIACFGMSAGGIGPLKAIVREISTRTGMAFVVLHLRDVPTMLPEILSTCTHMPVELATDKRLIRPNHVYVLPSGMEVRINDSSFSLRPRSKRSGFSNVLTIFLESLVDGRHPAVAVILSGVNADGAAALRTFERSGGSVIAQAPWTAQQTDMPLAAIRTGTVNHVLTPQGIAGQLERIGREFNEPPNANKNGQGCKLP
jgi:chemotaxis response regulator CheB